MTSRSKLRAALFLLIGVALFAWIAYDATSVQKALGLTNLVSEAAVAVAGLLVAGCAVAMSWISWRRGRLAIAAEPAR